VTSNKSINYQDDLIVDSGCLNHMIGDMNKLQNMTEYKEDRVVMMEIGFKMPIAHICNYFIAPQFSLHHVQL